MGEAQRPFHPPTSITVVVTIIVDAVIAAVLKLLAPEPFWLGLGLGGIVAFSLSAATWQLTRKAARASADVSAAKLGEAVAKVTAAEASLKEALQQTATREGGLELLHRAVEAVRRAAIAHKQDGGYSREDFRDDLRQLVETRLREYMRARLGSDIEYAVTVKWIQTATDGSRRLVAVFRDSIQGPKRAAVGIEDLEGNYFYEKFKAGEHVDNDLLCLVVHDTQLGEIPASLKNRARDRRYNSCLVIPLNLPLPAPFEAADGFGLVGFLSIDAPKSWIFTKFFNKLDASRDFGCQGQNHVRTPELNLLYGLADSIATIYLLTEEEVANGK